MKTQLFALRILRRLWLLLQSLVYVSTLPLSALAADKEYPEKMIVQGAETNEATLYSIQCEPPHNGRLSCKVNIIYVTRDSEQPICSVSAFDWKQEFTQQGPAEWVSNLGPSNTCQTVSISKLYKEPLKDNPSNLAWVYEIQDIDTVEGQTCNAGVVRRHRYDLDRFLEQKPTKVDCSYINFVPL